MIEKKHKHSTIKWDETKKEGNFKVTSNRNKTAYGKVTKLNDGKYIAFIKSMGYSNTYGKQKIKSVFNAVMNISPKQLILVLEPLDCLNGYIYTHPSYADGLDIDDSTRIDGIYQEFCNNNGSPNCEGYPSQGPGEVIFKGFVEDACNGDRKEFAKFKTKD